MHLRNSKKNSQNISLNEPIGMDKDGGKITLLDMIADEETESITTVMERNENILKLKRFLHLLNDREYAILAKRYGLNNQKEMTQREIARQENISRSYVSRIEKRAFIKLLKAFLKDEKENR